MRKQILSMYCRCFTALLGVLLLWIFLDIYVSGTMMLTEPSTVVLNAEIAVSGMILLLGLYGIWEFYHRMWSPKERYVQVWSKREDVYVLLDTQKRVVVSKSRGRFNGIPMRRKGR